MADTIGNNISTPVMIYGRNPSGVLQAVTTDGSGNLNITGAGGGGSGTVTSVIGSAPIVSDGSTTTPTISCPTCTVATSPGVGIAHFAGGTQTVTSSAVNLASADVTGVLPVANGGSGAATFSAHNFLGNNTGSTAAPAASLIGASDYSPNVYAVATGLVNVLAVTLSPAVTALTAGLEFNFLPNIANTTTTPTLNVNGLGAVVIKRYGAQALVANDLITTMPAKVIYDGTQWELMNPQTGNVPFSLVSAANITASAGTITGKLFASGTNCSSAGGTCVAASAGSVSIAGAATTVTVATTAVTANSQILIQRDDSLGTRLGITCNTQSSLVLGTPRVIARTGATSFVITVDVAPTTNPLCLSYTIVN